MMPRLKDRTHRPSGFLSLAALLLPALACRTLPDGKPGGGAVHAPGGITASAPPPSSPAASVPAPSAGTPAAPPFLRDNSERVTWACKGEPCPWGASLDGHALVWPTGSPATTARLGYLVSAPIYLPGPSANGATVRVLAGKAVVYAGPPDQVRHRELAMVTSGRAFRIVGLPPGVVASVQSDGAFSYELTPARTENLRAADEGERSRLAVWTCDRPGCTDPEWMGMVISWPSWSAHQSNGRPGAGSRAVQTLDGEPLYPYMGAWANGCKVTATSGDALIVEWRRGAETWRETRLRQGQTHVIALLPSEDSALIESNDPSPGFSVTFESCTPRPLPGARGPAAAH